MGEGWRRSGSSEGFESMITDYHVSYYAHELSRGGGTDVDRLVESLEKRMQQKTTVTPVFTIRWSVI